MINIFGSNYTEIGTEKENLILNTAGKIKIRFGKKFVDLINSNDAIYERLLALEEKVAELEAKN